MVLEQQQDPVSEIQDQKVLVQLVVAERDLALGKSVPDQQRRPDWRRRLMVVRLASRGSLATARPWIEIDFGSPQTVSSVRLLPAVQQPAEAVIELWVWDAPGRYYPIHLFTQRVYKGEPLTVRLPQPPTDITRLRVATTLSTAPLGWREVIVTDQ